MAIVNIVTVAIRPCSFQDAPRATRIVTRREAFLVPRQSRAIDDAVTGRRRIKSRPRPLRSWMRESDPRAGGRSGSVGEFNPILGNRCPSVTAIPRWPSARPIGHRAALMHGRLDLREDVEEQLRPPRQFGRFQE